MTRTNRLYDMLGAHIRGTLQSLKIAAQHQGDTADSFDALLDCGALLADAVSEAQEAIDAWAVLAVDAGASWAQIGESLGISRQAAQQRFGSYV
jgi:hypothetical protein